MDALLLSVRVLLAAVFAVAAISKFLDLAGTRHALQEFGVSARLARPGGIALPVTELAIAIALLIRPSARWGAAGALLLLILFVGGVARAMSQGRAPDCHCFGQLHSEPARRSTLIRNVVLAAGAALVAAAGSGPSVNGAVEDLNDAGIGLVALSVVVALLALTVAQLWADRRRLTRQLGAPATTWAPGLRRGSRAPDFDLAPVRGTARGLAELTERMHLTVLVFVSTGCGACIDMLPSLGRWQESLTDSVTLAAIFAGDRGEIARLSEQHELRLVLTQENMEVFERYRLRVTPSAVPVGSNGVIVGAPAEGLPAIEALIRAAVAESRPTELLARTA